jgi:hypothetical protein
VLKTSGTITSSDKINQNATAQARLEAGSRVAGIFFPDFFIGRSDAMVWEAISSALRSFLMAKQSYRLYE